MIDPKALPQWTLAAEVAQIISQANRLQFSKARPPNFLHARRRPHRLLLKHEQERKLVNLACKFTQASLPHQGLDPHDRIGGVQTNNYLEADLCQLQGFISHATTAQVVDKHNARAGEGATHNALAPLALTHLMAAGYSRSCLPNW